MREEEQSPTTVPDARDRHAQEERRRGWRESRNGLRGRWASATGALASGTRSARTHDPWPCRRRRVGLSGTPSVMQTHTRSDRVDACGPRHPLRRPVSRRRDHAPLGAAV
jgi:hypothetical protein